MSHEAMRLAHLDVAQEWERVMAVHTQPFKNPATAAYAAGLYFAQSRIFKRLSEALEAETGRSAPNPYEVPPT